MPADQSLRQRAFQHFIGKGWSPAQASGIVGNLLAENNGMDPGLANKIGAYGIAQWLDRRPALEKFARERGQPSNDFETQLAFIDHELATTESYAASQLRAAKTPRQAAAAFAHFERAEGYSRDNPTGIALWDKRAGNAEAVHQQFADYPGTPGMAPDASAVTATPDPTAKVSWQNPIQPTTPITDVEQHQAAFQSQQAHPAYGTAEAFGKAFTEEGVGGWIWQSMQNKPWEPNFKPSMDQLKAWQNGIPEEYHGAFGGALSTKHGDQIRDNILRELDYERRMANTPGSTALRIGAGFLDPVADAAILTAPEIAIPARIGRIGRIATKGVEAAGINAVLEAPRIENSPTADRSQYLWAAGTGLALGAAFGAIGRNPATASEADQLMRIGKSIQKHSEAEIEAGQQLVSPPGGSVGAASASYREGLKATTEDWLHRAVDDAIDRSAFDKVRFDLAGKGKASENPLTRAFTSGTVVDVVGNKDKSKVVQITAEEWQRQLDWDFSSRAIQEHQKGFFDYMKDREIPASGKAEAEVEFRQQVTAYMDNVRPELQFDPNVKKVGDALHKLYADWLEYAKNPGLLDGTTRRPVAGFENVSRENYRPAMSDHEKIDWHTNTFGDKSMREFIAEAFLGKSPELGRELARKMATGYWRTMREAVAGITNLDRAIHGNDLEALKTALADMGGLSSKEIDHVVSIVTPKPSEGATMARAKRRAIYDLNFKSQVRDTNGALREVSMRDLFHDDSLKLFKSYTRQMSGQVAMAMVRVKNPLFHAVENPTVPEHLIDGITSKAEFDKALQDMKAVWDAKGDVPLDVRKASVARDEKRMQFMYDRVTGVPQAFKSTTAGRALKAAMDYNYVRIMNQVGLAQIGEMMGVVTQLGLKAASEGMPALKSMFRDARTGKLNTEFAREMEELSGFGADWWMDGYHLTHDAESYAINRSSASKFFNKADDLAHKGKRVTNAISLMGPVDTFSRRWASSAVVMKIVNAAAASDAQAIRGVNMQRMAAIGIDEGMARRIFDQIKKHATFDGGEVGGRNYVAGNFLKWDDREALSAFRGGVWRWSRMIIQDPHIGQTNTWLGHQMGRMIFQFRNFMLGSWTNQFLRNIHVRDWNGFATWMTTSVFGGAVYSAQTYLNSMGRSDQKDYLKDKLSAKGLAAAAFQRGDWSSLWPNIIDTGVGFAGFNPIFDTRSSGLASNFFDGFPAKDLYDSAHKGIRGVNRAVREGGWSQGEIRSLARILPFQNALGVAPLLNSMISHQPLRSPATPR
jgi:hypothetical protein